MTPSLAEEGGFTKEFHRAEIGTRKPALCGAEPPGDRPWRAAPKNDGADVLPPCPMCKAIHESPKVAMWLAA